MLRYGYITNGFADHSFEQVIEILSGIGYAGVGVTLDHVHLDPFLAREDRVGELAALLKEASLEVVIETGARYYLDPRKKHEPSMVSPDGDGRERRIAYYQRSIEIASLLGAPVVSLWSGVAAAGEEEERNWGRLLDGLTRVLEVAASHGIIIGFEPEPGMFIEDVADWRELRSRLDHPALGLTLDLGHLAVTEEDPLERAIVEEAEHLVNVHVDDVRERRHEHLPLGEGEIDFPPLLSALVDCGYKGLALVELSRHSHVAPEVSRRSLEFLREAESALEGRRTGREIDGREGS